MLKDYKEQIQDADLVLVGIGRELRRPCDRFQESDHK